MKRILGTTLLLLVSPFVGGACQQPATIFLGPSAVVDHVEERVEPAYPPSAPQQAIPLEVDLRLTVNRRGRVCDVALLGGHPKLVKPALAAARRWRFRPFFLDFKRVTATLEMTLTFDPQRKRELRWQRAHGLALRTTNGNHSASSPPRIQPS